MKTFITSLIALFLCHCSFGQAKPDTTIAAYIKKNGYYLFADSARLPPPVQKNYPKLVKAMTGENAGWKNGYVHGWEVSNNDKFLSFSMQDISGIRKLKLMEEKNSKVLKLKKKSKQNLITGILGSMGVYDGMVFLDKKTGVVSFSYAE